ncbi:MAG TPA: radical SAM protein [Gemmatimonadaceae bacterium]|nr:radical SAM protein [Gemmatimonadaceae bacterium]
MLSSRFAPWDVPVFLAKHAWLTARKRPILVNFEVTLRCNARCGFCDYWKTPSESRQSESQSFADAARFFNPLMITFTGGEPLLRRDLEDLVRAVTGAIRVKYTTILTHGGLLTVDRARSLWDAGINQFNISLDFLDGRHDAERGIPGLTEKILSTIPRLRAAGIDSIRFNTVIRNDNLDQLLPIVHRAESLGCGVNFSTYTSLKNANVGPVLSPNTTLDETIAQLLSYKRRRRGVITSSDYYLAQIPRYVRGDLREPCQSGLRTIHIDPTGRVKRCPDFPTDGHWTEYAGYQPIDCNACFYACRGEAQAPVGLSRVLDVLA